MSRARPGPGRDGYVVVAVLRALPGREDDLAALMRGHAAASRAEPGCRVFDVSRGEGRPRDFLLFERYDDEEAYARHRASAHYARFRAAGVPMLEHRGASPFVARHVLRDLRAAAPRDASGPPVAE